MNSETIDIMIITTESFIKQKCSTEQIILSQDQFSFNERIRVLMHPDRIGKGFWFVLGKALNRLLKYSFSNELSHERLYNDFAVNLTKGIVFDKDDLCELMTIAREIKSPKFDIPILQAALACYAVITIFSDDWKNLAAKFAIHSLSIIKIEIDKFSSTNEELIQLSDILEEMRNLYLDRTNTLV